MGKQSRTKRFLKPACCWLLSFALVFGMGTPAAYATEAIADDTGVSASAEAPAVTEAITQDIELAAEDVAEPADDADATLEAAVEAALAVAADEPSMNEEPPAFAPYIGVRIEDANGSPRPPDSSAYVGDVVYLDMTFYNTGAAPVEGFVLSIAAAGLTAQSGPWGQACTVAAGDSVSYTACYVVGEDAPQYLELTAIASMPGSEAQYYAPYPIAVERPVYRYVINYYADAADGSTQLGEGNYLGSYEGEASSPTLATLPEELLNRYLPAQGYEPLTAGDFSPYTLNEQGTTTIELVYSPTAPAPVEPDPVQMAQYAVYYYTAGPDGSTNLEDCTLCGIHRSAAPVGSTITLAAGTGKGELDYCLPLEGYNAGVAVDGMTELVLGEDAQANVLRVIYTPQSFAYGITLYAEGISMPLGRIEGTALYGSTVSFTPEQLNEYLPAVGYEPRVRGLEMVIGAGEGENEATITYTLKSYRYTVNYYKDSISEDNRLGDAYVGWGKFGQTVYNIPLNTRCPDGYRPIEGSRTVTITADEGQNVVNIVYERRSDIGYTVNYYQDGILDGVLLGTDRGTGTLGQDIPYVPGKYCPAGYDSNAELQGVQVICAYDSSNVLNVVYTHKAEYAYEVRYYKDSISPENMLGTPVTGIAPYQTAIPYDLELRVPSGYTALDAQLSGAQMVGSDARLNVLNIVYSKDTAIPYTVNYYLGSLEGELIGQVRGAGTFEDIIPFDAAAYLRSGYSSAAQTSGATYIGADASANVLNVVLPRASYGYTVNYYRDAVAEENLITREQGSALYLEAIPHDIAGHAPEGYDPQGTVTGSTVVSYDEGANALNVVYRPALFGYTINYYGGGTTAGQLLTSVAYEPRSYGSTVELSADELNAQRPQGYAALDQGVSITISADEAANVANVVFYPDFSDFYAAGLASLDATYDGSVHYVTAQGVYSGDIITYAYNGSLQTRIVGTDDNIGAEFRELTDGELPVLVTVTRGGITSNALRTTVRIGPAPVPPLDPTPVEPSPAPELPQPQPVPPAEEAPANPLPGVIGDVVGDVITAAGPAAAVVADALGLVDTPQADAATADAGLTTIEDEANPLAGPNDLQKSGAAAAGIGYILMLLAVLCLLAAFGLLVVRKRVINQMGLVKTSASVIHRARVTKLTRSIVILFVAAIVFCALWGVFLV